MCWYRWRYTRNRWWFWSTLMGKKRFAGRAVLFNFKAYNSKGVSSRKLLDLGKSFYESSESKIFLRIAMPNLPLIYWVPKTIAKEILLLLPVTKDYPLN